MCHFPSLTLGSPEGRQYLSDDGHDTGRYFEVLPHHLSLALPFRHQYLRPAPSIDHQRQLLPGRDSLAVTQVGLYGRDGSLVQVNFHPQLDPQGRQPLSAAGRPAPSGLIRLCSANVWNADFGKYGQSSSMLELLIGTHEDGGRGTARSIQSALKYGR